MTLNSENQIGPIISRGATADIYAWGENQVIKLFHAGRPEALIDYEFRMVRTIRDLDIVAPSVGEKIKVSGRWGITFDKINGTSMLEIMIKKPWQTESLAAEFAQIHAGLHHRKTSLLPQQKERLGEKISHTPKLSESEKTQLLHRLERLTGGDSICHGDFNPGNVIISPLGPVIIDWIDATMGNPDADLARTVLLIDKLKINPENLNFVNRVTLDFTRELFYSYYIKAYQELRPFSYEELHSWLPLVAAARLEDNIAGEEAILLELIRNPK